MTAAAPLDDDIDQIKTFQLDAFERMQTDPSRYVWRVVEEVGFLPSSGQRWERQIQLRLPSLPNVEGHERFKYRRMPFVVSLGTFRRRRFADFTVTDDNGSQCHLLTRRQHGHVLANCLLRQFLNEREWERAALQPIPELQELHACLARLITAVPSHEDGGFGVATKHLEALLDALKITDRKRRSDAVDLLDASCKSIAKQTQYLCWVTGIPGTTVLLRACYTQSDIPRCTDETLEESRLTGSEWWKRKRLKWRNRRTDLYARYNIYPQRYTFDSPAFNDCRSYYFKITPPPDSRVALLDWGHGRRFRTMREERHLGWVRGGRARAGDMAAELDCADFAYHFHNRRTSPSEGGHKGRNQRRRGPSAGARIHAFVRIEPTDNSKLMAAGLLGLALAILAQRGSLYSTTSGASQWLLLTPGALVLFVTQQRRHHYAHMTTPYRVAVWLYILLAMLFAGSVAFDAPTLPLLGGVHDELVPRAISAAFALGSGLLFIASAWSAFVFEWATRKIFRRANERVRVFGTPAFLKVLRKYRWRKEYWRMPRDPLAGISSNAKEEHPSHKIYAAVARHEIDRALLGTGLVAAWLLAAMIFTWNWGIHEECAIGRSQARQTALAEDRTPPAGACDDGQWHPYRLTAQEVSLSGSAHGVSSHGSRRRTVWRSRNISAQRTLHVP